VEKKASDEEVIGITSTLFVLCDTFESKGGETPGFRKIHKEMFHILCFSPNTFCQNDQKMKYEIGGTCCVSEDSKNASRLVKSDYAICDT
jgi:hypothetical protein